MLEEMGKQRGTRTVGVNVQSPGMWNSSGFSVDAMHTVTT